MKLKRMGTPLALLMAGALALGGCSASDDETEAAEETTQTTEESTEASEEPAEEETTTEAATEVTIKHAYGEDTYPVNPERVLAMGRTAIDNVLALDVKPAAVVLMARDLETPWWGDALDGVKIIEVADFKEFKQEAYAAVQPDFIVGDGWKVTEETYPRLSEIAPTLGVEANDSAGRAWDKQLLNLGKVFDKEDEAQAIIDDTDAKFQAVKDELPGLEGKHAIVSQYIGDFKSFGVVANPDEPGNSFIYRLGMSVPDTIVNYPEQDKGRVTLSPENIDAMAADFMVIGVRGGTREDMEAIPGYSELPQVKSGAFRFAEPTLLQALNTPSAQSLTWALDELKPELEKAAE